jgi:twinkle protein
MSNDYGSRDDKYLETFLSECTRFAVKNNVYYVIVAHPHKLQKDKDTKAYPCPDVFDLAGGAMWNNKADNILVYHRPNHHTDPTDRLCELHSKKIRRQKIVGEKGVEQFDYDKRRRRFVFDDYPLQRFLEKNQIEIREFNTKDFTEPKKSEDDDFTVF